MAVITNDDLKTMIEVEELLHKKLVETNAIKDIDENGKEYYYFDENDKENDIWNKYWNLVEKFIVEKKDRTKIVNDRNKTIYRERHKLNNTISYLRNKKNKTEKDRKQYEELLAKREKLNNKKESDLNEVCR